MNDYAISDVSKRSEFPQNYTGWKLEEHKIRLFKEQIKGWQLDIADYLVNGTHKHPHSGFPALAIVVSYFENIGRYWHGNTTDKNVGFFFGEGIKEVYKGNQTIINETSKLYKFVRCGLYHMGLTQNRVMLSCSGSTGIFIDNGLLCVCPDKLVTEVSNHFQEYLNKLRDPKNKQLRDNFEKRFDALMNI